MILQLGCHRLAAMCRPLAAMCTQMCRPLAAMCTQGCPTCKRVALTRAGADTCDGNTPASTCRTGNHEDQSGPFPPAYRRSRNRAQLRNQIYLVNPEKGSFRPKNDPAEEFLLDKQPVIDDDMPATGGVGLLSQWRAHPNYHISMRQAELATFWISAGLPEKPMGGVSDLVCQNGPWRFGQCES